MNFEVNVSRVKDEVGDYGTVRGLRPGDLVAIDGGLRFETRPGQVLVEWDTVGGEPVGPGQSSWEDRADLTLIEAQKNSGQA